MGSLNIDNPEFFLLDVNDSRIETSGYGSIALDFGNPNYHAYALEATIND